MPGTGLWPTLTWLIALGAVLGLIWVAQALARLRLRGRAVTNRRLRLTETIALDTKRRLHLIACDGKSLLIETGGPNDIFLGWLPDA